MIDPLLLLSHACPEIFKLFDTAGETCPRKLAIGIVGISIVFIPDYPTGRVSPKSGYKMVRAPDNLIFTDAEELLKIIG